MATRSCPVCSGSRIDLFYEADRVPVHQNLVHADRDAALDCARGEIRLGLCRDCGFAFNLAFDPALLTYAGHYDNSQACSGVFSSYMEGLARELVERWDLHGKRVLEIGSGQGEFLELLCRLGPNSGVGFDPALIGEGPAGDGVEIELVRELYSERHRGREADFYCARHVLEHVQHPAELIGAVRGSIGDRARVALFLEVPSVVWILRETAFWDVFYEHCSYWGPDSLARLLAEGGFADLRVREAFAGQYLWAEGIADGAAPEGEGRVDPELVSLAESFAERSRARLEAIRDLIESASSDGRRCVLWGAAGKGVTLLNALGLGPDRVRAVVDVNPRKQGAFVAGTGQEIVAPESLSAIAPDLVLFTNPNYREEIAAKLSELGLEPELASAHG
jgi:hypothetical protein